MYVHAAARFKGKGQCNSPRRKRIHEYRSRQPIHSEHEQAAEADREEVIAANVQALIEQLEQGTPKP